MIHICKQPGLIMDNDIEVVQLSNGTWTATKKIGAIFGAKVEGQCTGKGNTKEEALVDLEKEQKELYESLWL